LRRRSHFGPNRRVGVFGAHVVAVDVERRQYVTAAVGWVSADLAKPWLEL
jgi:hypothetical protein